LEVETDKVVTEIPSPASGVVLKIAIPENTPARVGEVMAWIGQAGESISVSGATVPSDAGSKVEGQTSVEQITVHRPSSTVNNNSVFLSPVVRKIAAEHNINLSQITGTGLSGRITKQDVLDYVARSKLHVASQVGTREPLPRGTLLPVNSVRKQIAERMQQSKQISPHVLTVMEADMSRVVAHRAANKLAST
jgi:pyruvate/2-oxoglutarate dehydrogenase complex dihydrolipoamide acyltransferase (E2) component